MSAEVEVRIVEMRRAHPGLDPRTIGYHLDREGVVPVPSPVFDLSGLLRHNLVDPQKRRKRRSDYKRWERDPSMELWQMDVMGGVFLVDGIEMKVVTGLDDHSRSGSDRSSHRPVPRRRPGRDAFQRSWR